MDEIAAQLPEAKAARPGAVQELHPGWGDWLGCLWSAGSCWFMAGTFVVAWWWPRRVEDRAWVKLGVGVLVLEFILVHSGAIVNHLLRQKAGWGRTKALLGLVGLYSLFGLSIALAFRNWWLLGSFASIMVGRVLTVITGQDDMGRAISLRRVAASALLYLLLTFATVFIPVPRGGIDGALLDEVWPDRGDGVWERRPERALAMGAAYFLILGFVELRPPKRWSPPPETSGGTG